MLPTITPRFTTTDAPCSCDEKLTPAKEPGIYEKASDTRLVLEEIMHTLDNFKREIWNYNPTEGGESKSLEPGCFTDEICLMNSMAHAIKGDLDRLIAKFH